MRIRALIASAALALAVLAPAASASADVCYSVFVQVNGDVVADESDCIPT